MVLRNEPAPRVGELEVSETSPSYLHLVLRAGFSLTFGPPGLGFSLTFGPSDLAFYVPLVLRTLDLNLITYSYYFNLVYTNCKDFMTNTFFYVSHFTIVVTFSLILISNR